MSEKDDLLVGRIAGVPVAVHWSVLVIMGLLTWSLAEVTLPASAPGHTTGGYWLAGLVGAVALVGCLLAHELAHAIVARRSGIEVRRISLWVFGGIATLSGEPSSPAAEFRIAVAGPGTSLALGAGFALFAVLLDALGDVGLVATVVGWLAMINLLLAVFNLVPGAPLDGGRILRAALWWRSGDRHAAAIRAARAGRRVGHVLIALGLVVFLVGAGLGGLWLAFIGWFILNAARAEERAVVTRQRLGGVRVGDVMGPAPRVAPGWITVGDFIEHYLVGGRQSSYPVEGRDGRIHGVVTLDRLGRIPMKDRRSRLVVDVAIPLRDVPTATPTEPVVDLIERLAPSPSGGALVFAGDELVGIVTPVDVDRAIEVRGLRDGPPTATPAR